MNRESSKIRDAAAKMNAAIESGDKKECENALEEFGQAIAESVASDYVSANGDKTILQARGFRVLTSVEEKYYQNLIKAGKSKNPKQTFEGLTDNRIMPLTIIEDVYKELTEEHPLLAKINFQSVEFLTRWILNDHTVQTAVWGEVNTEIAKEITSAFKVVEITQCKLSAYAIIDKDMLDLGPVFLDNYIRTFLKESIADALETAIVSGSGHNCPIGLDRDVHKGVSVSTETGYPEKTAIKVNSFLPVEYGNILSKLAVTEKGNVRTFDQVTLICNQVDYLKKIMPATTVLNAAGTYSQNVFPFPTDVIRCNRLPTDKVIVCLPEEYFIGIGTSKDGTIEYSDDVKFFEDQRCFKIKLHAMGKPYDNTIAVVLDISELDPAYITVLNKDAVPVA